MDCLSKLILAKRLPIKDILSSYCVISVKEDGNAFQIYKDQIGNIRYGKRYDSPFKMGKELTEFDFLSYDIYFKAFLYFCNSTRYEPLAAYKDIKTFNFEILDSTTNHIIKNSCDNEIVLLSAYTYDDKPVPFFGDLCPMAKSLGVRTKNVVFDGVLNSSDINLLMSLKDSPDDINTRLWTIFNERLDIPSNVEGIVLQFLDKQKNINRNYKIQSPDFKEKLDEHLLNESEIRFNDIDDSIASIVNKCVRDAYHDIYKSTETQQSYAFTLINIFKYIVDHFERIPNNFFICNKITNFELIKNLPMNYAYMKSIFSDAYEHYEPYMPFLKYILLVFRNARHSKPLMCTLDVQTDINETIEMIKNNSGPNMIHILQQYVRKISKMHFDDEPLNTLYEIVEPLTIHTMYTTN